MYYAHKTTHPTQKTSVLLEEFMSNQNSAYLLYDAATLAEEDYKKVSQQLKQYGNSVNLFEHTQDNHLKDTAPWLVLINDLKAFMASPVLKQLQKSHENSLPCMTWLISDFGLTDLQNHLTPFLDVRLRNGKEAVMRFYDPRVLPTFFKMLSDEQINNLMTSIRLWAYHDVKQNQYITYQGVNNGVK